MTSIGVESSECKLLRCACWRNRELLWNLLIGVRTWCDVQFSFGFPRTGVSWGVICSDHNPCTSTDEHANGLVLIPGLEVWGWGRRQLPSSFPDVQCGHLLPGQPLWGAMCLTRAPCEKQSLVYTGLVPASSFLLS